MEFSPVSDKNKYIKTLEIAQFSKNFEEKIIIRLIFNVMTIEVEYIQLDYQPEYLT